MPKPTPDDPDAPKKLTTYTIKLDDAQMEKLRGILDGRGWEAFEVAYARFAFKGRDCNVTAYTSGKVVIAGKGTEDFVVNTLETEVTQAPQLGYEEINNPEYYESHAGLDESGKGDFFGPVVAATVIAEPAAIRAWIKAGAKDSKKLAEPQIMALDALIRRTPGAAVEVFCFGMPKYNELMAKPRANLNNLLAWMHATALAKALTERPVKTGLLDQFTEKPLVQKELIRMGVKDFELKMRTKAESDPVVAAASVVARAEYVRRMHALSEKFGAKLQKGAGPLVKVQAHEIITKLGARALGDFAKLHFRTAYEVVKAAGKLDELPLPEPKAKLDWD